ncbi:NADH:flavin oxidoreductase [Nocardioides albus]|uniref:2,4-dienoyl-CoA reductase-like NADH-dependent reductase (Old Yellow Enzyme family) n=1 Tax=Nocardioides albus TaxID=1841 RepID=A0A7W5FAF6_9ACTN|nr:NADH:flavin oxidoreductase [Nocardioides albus]MBB3091254.1 2,4-dienoyl-CoA reductase-like NADH-dependent reductase (Old Yellow Enzyme family) [Nocardioides albus]GGU40396.1 putative oxidoreductase [Nocardioides albus]
MTDADAVPGTDPLAPATLGPVTLRNRVIKAATFEGASPDALVSDRLIDYHLAVAEGGVGMTTVAYLAVAPEGRTHADCIYWRPAALPGLRRLTEEVHKTGAKVSAQIGHAGPVANAKSNGSPSLAPTRSFNALGMAFNRAATAEDLARVVEQHADAARMAVESGFDAIEVHLGHNYLPSSFLSPRLNPRTDEFGGPLANRASFPRRILAAVREAVGDQVAVLAKMNMRDGYRGGFDLPESVEFARLIESDGHLDALELTGGSSFMNPMYLFRGDAPYREMAANMPLHPMIRMGMRLVGKRFFKEYPYKPLYFLDNAREFRRALSMPLVLLGGVTDMTGMRTAMDEGFEYVAMARALLREPDLINRLRADPSTVSRCTHCNLCMSTIYPGTHCHLDTEHVYGEAHPILLPPS